MQLRNVLLKLILVATTGLFMIGIANAQLDPGVKYMPGFGMIGIAYDQSAQLNVYIDSIDEKLFPPGPCKTDTGLLPPGPCKTGPWRVTLRVMNDDGRVLGETQQTVELHALAVLQYTPHDISIAGERKQIRPVMLIEPDANGVVPCIKQTFELIDNRTQRTAVVFNGQNELVNPMNVENESSVKTFGVVEIGSGQAARLNVVNTEDIFTRGGFPPGPCRVTLNFYDSNGRLLMSSNEELDPGKASSIDLNFNMRSGRLAFRAEVVVEMDPNGLIPCVMPTLELFDVVSGKTTSIIAES